MNRQLVLLLFAALVAWSTACAPAAAPAPTVVPAKPKAEAPVPSKAEAPAAPAAKDAAPAAKAEAAPSGLQKARQDAEGKGYVFAVSHDEILDKAKQEGKLRVLTGLSSDIIKPLLEAFRKKYPFLDTSAEEIEGVDAYQRFILEMKAGAPMDWDVSMIPNDYYPDYIPHMKKFDILGMGEQGVVKFHPKMVHPTDRNTVGVSSTIQIVAYNKKLVPPDRVPNSWDDLTAPHFKGRQVVMDTRALMVSALVPAWGVDKTAEWGRKMAAQQPIWIRGGTRAVTSMAAGEYTIMPGPNFNTIIRAMEKDTGGDLQYKILEPVPTRYLRADGVLASSKRPYAGLLWLEFQASDEGQAIMEKFGPHEASIYTPGMRLATETRGKQLSLVDWEHFTKLQDYAKKVEEAYGFPKAETS